MSKDSLPWFRLPNRIAQSESISLAAFRVLTLLKSYSEHESGKPVWPSLQTICRKSGLGKRKVLIALKELVRLRIIQIESGKSGHRSNHYVVKSESEWDWDAINRPRLKKFKIRPAVPGSTNHLVSPNTSQVVPGSTTNKNQSKNHDQEQVNPKLEGQLDSSLSTSPIKSPVAEKQPDHESWEEKVRSHPAVKLLLSDQRTKYAVESLLFKSSCVRSAAKCGGHGALWDKLAPGCRRAIERPIPSSAAILGNAVMVR